MMRFNQVEEMEISQLCCNSFMVMLCFGPVPSGVWSCVLMKGCVYVPVCVVMSLPQSDVDFLSSMFGYVC